MDYLQIFLIALGLSMDAFAAAVCKGLQAGKLIKKEILMIALSFGFFQGFMPLIGWFLGIQFYEYITGFDHWIAFILLLIIGGKMLYEAFQNEACPAYSAFTWKELMMLSVATSIDALAIGVTFAMVKTPIVPASLMIAFTTAFLSAFGVFMGVKFGSKYKKVAEIAGGIILIGIGIKIMVEHADHLFIAFI